MKLVKYSDRMAGFVKGSMAFLLSALVLVLASVATAAGPDSHGVMTVPRLITGVMDGRFTFEQWGTEWWEIDTLGDVEGALRHLGLAHMYTRHTPNLDGTLSNGEFAIVAANGDEIRGTYTGSGEYISESEVLGTATFLIEEGTGRFDGASGTINAAFLETLDDPTWASAQVSWTLAGMVSY
jgi:hypothetical protein